MCIHRELSEQLGGDGDIRGNGLRTSFHRYSSFRKVAADSTVIIHHRFPGVQIREIITYDI